MESGLPNTWRAIWANSNVLRTHELTSYLSDDDEHNLQTTGNVRMVLHLHGRWHNPHETPLKWDPRTISWTTLKIHPWNLWYSSRKRPIRQIREMHFWTRRNWLFGRHRRQRTIMNGPKEIARSGQLPNPTEHHRCSSIPRVHRLLPIFRPKLLCNRPPPTWPYKEREHIQMGNTPPRGVRQNQSDNVQGPCPSSTRL